MSYSPRDAIQAFGSTHLVCHGALANICGGSVQDEAYLYAIEGEILAHVIERWRTCFKMPLKASDRVDELSGGQQVVLAVLCALASPAPRIAFVSILHALDADTCSFIKIVIAAEPEGRILLIEEDLL